MAAGDAPGGYKGKWYLCDEKYHLNNTNPYDSKEPQRWLQDIHDYLSDRNSDLDRLVHWIEHQTEAVAGDYSMVPSIIACAEIKEVSKQLWAFLGPLIRADVDLKRSSTTSKATTALRRGDA